SREEAGDRLVPRDPACDLLAGLTPGLRVIDVLAQPRTCFRERCRPRLTDDPGAAISDDFERAAGVGGRDHRLLGQKGFVRDHPEVLVHRRVVDREAACVQTRELLLVDATREARAAVETVPLRNLLEPLAV